MSDLKVIDHVQVSSADIVAAIQKIEPALDGMPLELIFVACLAIAFLSQDQNISSEQLQNGIQETSEFIAKYIQSLAPEEVINLAPSNYSVN